MENHNITKKKKKGFSELILNHIHITKGFSTSVKNPGAESLI